MPAKTLGAYTFLPLLVLLARPAVPTRATAGRRPLLSPEQAQTLVRRALSNELHAAENRGQPLRFTLLKSSPRLTTVKKIIETREGDVARLISVNDEPLNAAAEQKGAGAPYRPAQRSRPADEPQTARRQRPQPRRSRCCGRCPTPSSTSTPAPAKAPPGRWKNSPSNPIPPSTPLAWSCAFSLPWRASFGSIPPPNGQSTSKAGSSTAWPSDGASWATLNRGGWITIDQANVADNQWRTVRLQLKMSGRVLFISKTYDTLEEQSHYQPVPENLGYREAIKMLRVDP